MKTALPFDRPSALPSDEAVLGRLKELEATLVAIDEGQLLAALPTNPEDRGRHQAAVSLLMLLRRELHALIVALEPSAATPSLKRVG